MKIIFITSFHQFISRNILRTAVLDGLLNMPDVRVVIAVPSAKKDYFMSEFGERGAVIEGVEVSREANGPWSFFFKRLARAASEINYKTIVRGQGKGAGKLRSYFVDAFFYTPARFLGRYGVFRKFMRFSNSLLVKNKELRKLFDKYSPDLVFSTDVQNENDVMFSAEAKRRNIKVVAMFRSWDNIEMQGLVRVIPDTLLVWGEYLKNEIVKLDNISANNVKITGVPHYDRYLKGATMPREAFFESLGADPSKKLILFTPIGDMYMGENDVDGLVLSELAKFDANILVRMPPADKVSWGEYKPGKNVFFYQPGKTANHAGRGELSLEDENHLINSIYFSDLVVTGPSSIMLDASIFDKPVLLFGFEKNKKSHEDSVLSQYDLKYLKTIIDSGAVILAKSKEEFNSAVSAYFSDPKKNSDGRRRAVEYLCYRKDGRSSERVAVLLKSAISAQ